MDQYTQNSTDSTLEFSPRHQEFWLAELSYVEKYQEHGENMNLGDRMQVFDSTLTIKQTGHAGLSFLPLFQIKEEGNGN